MSKTIAKNILYTALGIALIMTVWGIAAAVCNEEIILSKPSTAFREALRLFHNSEFWRRTVQSFWTTICAFSISFVLALALALWCRFFDVIKILAPIIAVMRSLPTMVLALLFVLWTDSQTAPVFVAILVVLPVLFSSFLLGLNKTDPDIIAAAKVFGATKFKLARRIYLPLLSRNMIENTAAGISLCFKIVVSAEIMLHTAGSVGQFMENANRDWRTAELMASAMIVCFICIILELVIRLPLKKFKYQ